MLVSILGKFASVSMNLCKKDKCTKVPVETTQYVEQKQCLPFELDLAHMSAHHGDPCASYDQGVINAQVFFLSTGSPCNSQISGEIKIRELQNHKSQGPTGFDSIFPK